MPSYNVLNSQGNLVTTLNIGTTSGANFPIELIGQGISLYGPIVATTQYHLMEHFANTTEPTNAVEGMVWYELPEKLLNYYDGTQFLGISGAANNYAHQFKMLGTATNVNFAAVQTVQIFQAPGLANITHHPTGVMLVPKVVNDGGLPPITPATFNLYIDTSEDILENVNVVNPGLMKHAFFNIQGMTRFAENAEVVNLEIVTAASGAGVVQLVYDVFLFGYQNVS